MLYFKNLVYNDIGDSPSNKISIFIGIPPEEPTGPG